MTRLAGKLRPFGALFGLGSLGVLALIVTGLLDPGQYAEAAEAAGLSTEVVILASAVQSAAFLAVAVAVGMYAAPRVGFVSRVYRRAADGTSVAPGLRSDARPGLVAGVAVGGLLLVAEVVSRRVLDLGGQEMTVEALVSSLPVRLLYGGITEELLLRWGVMSLFALALWRLAGGARETPSARVVWTAIVASAVAFGALHLPAAAGSYGALTPALVAFIVGANAVGGVVFGWLFWRHSLEAGMLAHATAHAVAVSVWLALGPV